MQTALVCTVDDAQWLSKIASRRQLEHALSE
jgi:hypothetical protein